MYPKLCDSSIEYSISEMVSTSDPTDGPVCSSCCLLLGDDIFSYYIYTHT